MQISIQHDLDQLTRRLGKLQRQQLPFAVSKAINHVALRAKDQLVASLPKQLDRPKPFTLRAPMVKRGNKRAPAATVYLGEKQAEYLRWPVLGGPRTLAPGRSRLVVPGKSLRLDRYGGVPRARTGQARAGTRANTFTGVPRGHGGSLPAGIWQRHTFRRGPRGGRQATKVRILVEFGRPSDIRPARQKWSYYATVQATVSREFRTALNQALAAAVASAK